MSIVNDIRSALDGHLAAATGLPVVAFDNVGFEQVPRTSHIRVQFVPTSRRPANRGPNPQHRHQGLYILTVCTEMDKGTGPALDIVDALLTRFNGSSDILGGDVPVSIEYSEAQGSFRDDPFYCMPVQVSWYAYE
jgi:hypothetical protein